VNSTNINVFYSVNYPKQHLCT